MARQEKRRSYAEMGNRRRSWLQTREVIKQPTSLKEARDRTNQVINEKKRKLEEYEALMVVLLVRMAVYQEKLAMLQENVNLTKKELHAKKT
ncbi:hypothetical protein Peur_067361 [Populus x canadensis]